MSTAAHDTNDANDSQRGSSTPATTDVSTGSAANADATGRTSASTGPSAGSVCTVDDLVVRLTGSGTDVVDRVDLTLAPGEILGLVGESGSGKTTAGTALLGYARRGAAISDGQILVAGHDVRAMSDDQVRRIRGVDVAYVPQDPSSALNPAHRIHRQLRELLDLHDVGPAGERDTAIRDILREVGLPDDDEFLRRYPHQLSGGQVQRVALAMVFLPRPKVLVLDEPTTGLDVTTQGMVLATLATLCERYDVAALYVTHDLAVVARIADRVAVLYAGRVAEIGPTRQIFAAPAHPYTRALLAAIPHLHQPYTLTGIPGSTPPPGHRPSGCRFHDRCAYAVEECAQVDPDLVPASGQRTARVEGDRAGAGAAGAIEPESASGAGARVDEGGAGEGAREATTRAGEREATIRAGAAEREATAAGGAGQRHATTGSGAGERAGAGRIADHAARCIRLAELPAYDPSDRVVRDTDPEAARDIVLDVTDLEVSYGARRVVHSVSFDLAAREIVALVGESGSGKTTISRCVGGLHDQWTGEISFRGEALARAARKRTGEQRRQVQYVFQNPYASLNPRRTIEQILVRPLRLFGIARSDREAKERAAALLEDVQLGSRMLGLRANRLSGGERQRVAIARALAAEPSVLVCDEITSALDVSIQGAIVDLLMGIKHERGISMVFVTHDLPLVRTIADRVLVLQHGSVVESGLTAQIIDDPREDYTRTLLANTPTI